MSVDVFRAHLGRSTLVADQHRPCAYSIFFYLMDSDGQFVDAFGKNSTSPEITAKVMEHVDKWKAAGRAI